MTFQIFYEVNFIVRYPEGIFSFNSLENDQFDHFFLVSFVNIIFGHSHNVSQNIEVFIDGKENEGSLKYF